MFCASVVRKSCKLGWPLDVVLEVLLVDVLLVELLLELSDELLCMSCISWLNALCRPAGAVPLATAVVNADSAPPSGPLLLVAETLLLAVVLLELLVSVLPLASLRMAWNSWVMNAPRSERRSPVDVLLVLPVVVSLVLLSESLEESDDEEEEEGDRPSCCMVSIKAWPMPPPP